MNSSKVKRAFLALTAVAFLVLAVESWQIATVRTLARDNKALIVRASADKASIQSLEKAQAESCQNFETLKAAVNDFHGTIRQLLLNGRKTDIKRAANIKNPKLRAADLEAVRGINRLLRKTHTVTATCAQKQARRAPQGSR